MPPPKVLLSIIYIILLCVYRLHCHIGVIVHLLDAQIKHETGALNDESLSEVIPFNIKCFTQRDSLPKIPPPQKKYIYCIYVFSVICSAIYPCTLFWCEF